ncbi:NACHT domain-containing protein [Rhizobium leguminosarum]
MSGGSAPIASITHSTATNGDVIAQVGLNEAETAALFERLLKERDDAAFVKAAQSYVAALLRYSDSSYQLASFASANLASSIYVPAHVHVTASSIDADFDAVVRACLSQKPRRPIILQGKPGSGKSTVLRELARHAWAKPELLGLEGRHLVIPIRLRSYSETEGVSREEHIWSAIGRARDVSLASARPPEGFLQQWPLLLGAPLLFLLDGLDEVPDAREREVLKWVLDLAGEQAKIIVTCRPGTLTGDTEKIFSNIFERVELLAFDAAQERRLAEEWFGDGADAFIEEFGTIPRGELAGTPLLLTVAAGVFASNGMLPRHRSGLYGMFIDIVWREGLRRCSPDELGGDIFDLAEALIPECLRQVAMTMSMRQDDDQAGGFATESKLMTDLLARTLASALSLPQMIARRRAEQMYDFLGSRSGILISSPDEIEWIHPTFREYLTAEGLLGDTPVTDMDSVLAKAASPSWRQVILFALAIGSERGPVDRLMEKLLSANTGTSVSVAGSALGEGANVNHDLAMRVIDAVVDKIAHLSDGGYCEGLLIADTAMLAPLREALSTLESYPGAADALERLKTKLEASAILYGRRQAAALEELKELRAVDSVERLAITKEVPLEVRIDAASLLYGLGHAVKGCAAFQALAHDVSYDHSGWREAVAAIANAGGDVLDGLQLDDAISDVAWTDLLDAVSVDSREDRLIALLSNDRAPEFKRLAVKLRLNMASGDVLELLPRLVTRPPLLLSALNRLAANDDRDALARLIVDDKLPGAAKGAIRQLKRLEDRERLLSLLQNGNVAYSLRRRAAEALFGIDSLSLEEATGLLAFFDSLGKENRPLILQRRAFLNYASWNTEEAVSLLQRLFQLRQPTGWELEVFAHCLQRLGRADEAIASYSQALKLRPDLTFSRCRTAELLLAESRIPEAVEMVETIWRDQAPEWFPRTAIEIMRRAGKPERAELWARRRENSPEMVAQEALDLSEIAFDKGRSQSAIAGLRRLVGNENLPHTSVRYLLGITFRAVDQIRDAYEVFSELINDEDDAWSNFARGDFADVALRLGYLEQASETIQKMMSDAPDEPFSIYLGGVFAGLQFDQAGLRRMVSNARSLQAELYESRSPVFLSNHALCSMALQDFDQASRRIDQLIRDGQYTQLRHYTIPYLETLSLAVGKTDELSSLQKRMIDFAWPNGCDLDSPSRLRKAALLGVRRTDYRFPIYCQRYWIDGLPDDQALAARILQRQTDGVRTIALWTLGRPDRVYGQCNFKKDRRADENLKFCDETQTLVHTNFEGLTRKLGARRLLFLEEELREKFEFAAHRSRLDIECAMADLSEEL